MVTAKIFIVKAQCHRLNIRISQLDITYLSVLNYVLILTAAVKEIVRKSIIIQVKLLILDFLNGVKTSKRRLQKHFKENKAYILYKF